MDELYSKKSLELKIENAQKHRQNIYDAFVEESKEGRKTTFEFYNRLAFFSGGVITLSVTYIGYLLTIRNYTIQFADFLILAWCSLLFCVYASIYRNYYYSNFIYFQLQERLYNAQVEEAKLAEQQLKKYPKSFINAQTSEDLAKNIEVSDENIERYEQYVKLSKEKELTSKKWWIKLEALSHVSFILGLFFVIIFASLNLPHVKFIFFQYFVSVFHNH